jgi:hypothetical protein
LVVVASECFYYLVTAGRGQHGCLPLRSSPEREQIGADYGRAGRGALAVQESLTAMRRGLLAIIGGTSADARFVCNYSFDKL